MSQEPLALAQEDPPNDLQDIFANITCSSTHEYLWRVKRLGKKIREHRLGLILLQNSQTVLGECGFIIGNLVKVTVNLTPPIISSYKYIIFRPLPILACSISASASSI